jgi:Na+/H+ antiporter NhaA
MTVVAGRADAFRGRTLAGPRLASFREFLRTEAGGAVVLLAATLIALFWANSPWAGSYHRLWSTELFVGLGRFRLSLDLGDWVNDGLMTLFFLVIGLEVRREFDIGQLRERRRAAVPVLAGLGGMVVPALIFLAINRGSESARGWAMVMATDTAFALGVLALAGRLCPFRLRVFLLTLVVADDVGAIAVIAIVYSSTVAPLWLLLAAALLAAMIVARRRGVEQGAPYWLLGLGAWFATFHSGLHPTVAGVAIGLSTSAYAPRREELQRASGLARAFREQPSSELASEAARRITRSLSPNERLLHALHPWSSFVVVPLFALVNAGIELRPDMLQRAFTSPLTIGVVVALVVGKPVGITAGAWLATRRAMGGLPLALGWPWLIAAASVGGIGFTVSLLVAELSYTGPMLEEAKLGILGASIIAAAFGTLMLRSLAWLPADWLHRAAGQVVAPLTDLSVPVDPARDHVRGAPDAPVTVVEYEDFECPYCRRAAPVIQELLARHDGELRFVSRHLPLSDVHPHAALAAIAAEAAGAQGKFWEMHDLLFGRQDHLLLADLVGYAGELGLDVRVFEADLKNARFAERVAEDVAGAEAAGVAGTPTFFINDRRYSGAYDLDSLDAAVRDAGREARSRRSRVAAGSASAV